jgi:hypothetical protein
VILVMNLDSEIDILTSFMSTLMSLCAVLKNSTNRFQFILVQLVKLVGSALYAAVFCTWTDTGNRTTVTVM